MLARLAHPFWSNVVFTRYEKRYEKRRKKRRKKRYKKRYEKQMGTPMNQKKSPKTRRDQK